MASAATIATDEPLAGPGGSAPEPFAPPPARDDGRQLTAALALALALHLLPLLGAVGWVALGGSTQRVGLGDPSGKVEGVNVEVIDADEFDRRYVSFSKGREQVDSAAARRPEQQPPAEASTPREAQQQPEPPKAEPQQAQAVIEPAEVNRPQPRQEPPPLRALAPELPEPEPPPRRPEQTAALQLQTPPSPPREASPLTEAEINQILDNARAELEGVVEMTSMAGAARQGRVSEYVRGVLRQLKASMPRSPGVRGNVVVAVLIADGGEVRAGLLQSSGSSRLDKLVLDRVRSLRFPPPPANAHPQERQFQVTFAYN